ncbi:MAG TPA: MerR family transcriptional regulator [Lachnospiraceae bacterium]|nr:MerR family transcriptional regulator [Lachnospiraceae bacterium]
MLSINTYSTSQIAKIVGVHPNTMRMYEEWGMIQIPARKSNGYRVFTDIHIDQIHLAKKAFQIDILQAGLRVKIIAAVKYSAKYQFDQALSFVQEYLEIADREIVNAIDVVSIVDELKIPPKTDTRYLRRAEAARELGLTIDTIRNWEMNGLIKVKRKENGYRVYNSMDMNRLKVIRSLRCANYSLSAILRMLNALDRRKNVDVFEILNTPDENEDIVQACDKLIHSLKKAKENAGEVLQLLIEMKNKY